MSLFALQNTVCFAQEATSPLQVDFDLWLVVLGLLVVAFFVSILVNRSTRELGFIFGFVLLVIGISLTWIYFLRKLRLDHEAQQSVAAAQQAEDAAIKARMAALAAGDQPLIPLEHSKDDDSQETSIDPPSANAPRPTWVDQQTKRVGNVDRRVVAAGPWATLQECRQHLDELALQETGSFIEREFSRSGITGFDLAMMGITPNYVKREICTDEFVETSEHDFGEMKTLHVLMEFSPSVRQELGRRLSELQQRGNLVRVSLGSLGVFGIVGLAYGLLKIDRWTSGQYSKRLFIGVPLVIIALVGAALSHVL